EDPGSEVGDAVVGGGAEQLREQQRAKPLALPAVLDDDRDLRHAVVGRLVARDSDQRGRRRGEIFEDGREAAHIVDVGEKACPVRRQTAMYGEEALVARGMAGAVVEVRETRLVVGANG